MITDKYDPLNISILELKGEIISKLMEVKTVDIYEQNSTVFHHEGLFSTSIFGELGSEERMNLFGYMDLGLKILHPRIYKELISLSSIYKGILDGTKYATWDPKAKNFEESDKLDGETGFNFFMKHYDDIEFELTDSTQRLFKVLFIKKYKSKDIVMDKYLVIPAGLREYTVTDSGKVMENEINAIYRKLLNAANTAKQFKNDLTGKENEFIIAARKRLQRVAVEIYDYIENLLDGKSKFIQGKWAKRSVMYGTRNVITATPYTIEDLNDNHGPKTTDAIIGIYQAAKGILPKTIFQARTRFLHDVFDMESTNAMLINPKTLKLESKKITEKTRSKWITDEGLEEIINKLLQDEIKNEAIIVDGHYLLLVYEEKDGTLRIVRNITHVEEFDPKKARPMTYGELIYLSIFDILAEYPAFLTRYPIVGFGGTVPVIPYLKSTIKTEVRDVILPDTLNKIKVYEYPIIGTNWYNSLSPNFKHLELLGGDFDGDKVSLNFIWEEDAKKEVKKYLNSKSYYLTPTEEITFGNENLINKIVMSVLTR